MRKICQDLVAGFACVAAGAGTAGGQTAEDNAPNLQVFQSSLRPGATLDNVLRTVRGEFRMLDADGDGAITAADADLHAAMNEAGLRANSLVAILRADLDGDGFVTADELRRFLRYSRRSVRLSDRVSQSQIDQGIEAEHRRTMEADVDKDGRISVAEARDAAKLQPSYSYSVTAGYTARARQVLAFDADKDGRVTPAEIEKGAEAAFQTVDTDRNGTISQDEFTQVMQRMRPVSRFESAPACELPKASQKSWLVVLGAYETEAISSAALGSQDVETRAGTIFVEPGEDPVYIVVVTHRPTIWRVTGATERVERIVVSSLRTGPNRGAANEPPLAGVVGVAKERVTIPQNSRCINYFSEHPSTMSATTLGTVRRLTGKETATVGARYAVSAFAVPSGKIESLRKTGRSLTIESGGQRIIIEDGKQTVVTERGAALAERMLRHYVPGGVIEIDPAAVVSSKPAERYAVLPHQAGLLQLVKSGALAINDSGEYVIRQKIRLPAGLYGGFSVKFLLLRGVPEPEGDPGHSTIISEETGLPIKGTRVR